MILFLVLAYLLYKKSKNKYQIILPNEAKRLIKKGYFKKIIDVRSKDEYSKGYYPKAINIPSNILHASLTIVGSETAKVPKITRSIPLDFQNSISSRLLIPPPT